MSTIAGLRAATWASHQRLEKRLDVKARFTQHAAYRAHLEQMWGFCAALEPRIGDFFGNSLSDYEARRKIPLLTRDLIALGSDPARISELPVCGRLPPFEDTAGAFGSVYVLEGATLGGRTLLPLVESRLGLSGEHGASFLASYGEEVLSMWRVFGTALDSWCQGRGRRERATAAAVETFGALDHWLCGPP